jgi:hypothetical protein
MEFAIFTIKGCILLASSRYNMVVSIYNILLLGIIKEKKKNIRQKGGKK